MFTIYVTTMGILSYIRDTNKRNLRTGDGVEYKKTTRESDSGSGGGVKSPTRAKNSNRRGRFRRPLDLTPMKINLVPAQSSSSPELVPRSFTELMRSPPLGRAPILSIRLPRVLALNSLICPETIALWVNVLLSATR